MPTAPLYEIVREGDRETVVLNFHPGQKRAWASRKRIVAVIAGARAGKTSFGAPWMYREIQRRGPADYLVAAPSYQLLDKAAVPEVEYLFGRVHKVGQVKRSPFRFAFSDEGCRYLWDHVPERRPRLLFGHADDPDTLEAMTLRAAWLDEAGQSRFKLGSWEAVQRRLAVDQGRVLLTTTPYNLGWLKQKIHDEWEKAGRNHPEIDLIRFDSTANPAFPPEEAARLRRDLPPWKAAMFLEGRFTRPAGLIYDSFDETKHTCKRFPIPAEWPRYLGLDFGAVNTAGVFFAQQPGSGKLYAYREYHAGNRSSAEHAKALLAGEPRTPITVGGAPRTEDGWREAFTFAGLHVIEPDVKLVEVGIDRVYGAFRRDEVMIFDDLAGLLDELLSYSRVVDPAGQPTEGIEDKAAFHRLDAVRYIVGWLKRGSGDPSKISSGGGLKIPPGVFGTFGGGVGGKAPDARHPPKNW
jgi:hypothetical protein